MKAKDLLLRGLLVAFTLSPLSVVSSCGDDDPDPSEQGGGGGGKGDDGSGGSEDGGSTGGNTVLSPSQAKTRMESVAKEYMNQMDASNFTELSDLFRYVNEHFFDNEDFDHSAAEDFFEAAWDKQVTKDDEHTKEYGGLYWKDTYYYTDYTRLIVLSNFKGHFTESNGKWVKSSGDDLQFNFKDQNGQNCVLSVQSGGSTKKVYVDNNEDWDLGYGKSWQDENGDWWYEYEEYIDNYDNYLLVPETVTLTLTQGGKTQLSVVVNIDHSQFTGPEVDLKNDAVSASITTQIGNYTWIVDRVAANMRSGTGSVSVIMKKGSTTLLTASAEAAGVSVDTDNDEYAAGAVKVNIDILGQLQLKGTCSNGKDFVDALDLADSYYNNESRFKNYVNNANNLIDVNMYFDGGSAKQAWMKFQSFEDNYYGGSEWYYEPTIFFNDGTSYSLGDYFTESKFRSVIDLFEQLLEDYEDLVD